MVERITLYSRKECSLWSKHMLYNFKTYALCCKEFYALSYGIIFYIIRCHDLQKQGTLKQKTIPSFIEKGWNCFIIPFNPTNESKTD